MEKNRETTEFRGLFSSLAEPQSLVATELRELYSFALKGSMMHGTEDTLAKEIELGFHAADKGVKHAFLCIIEMALVIWYIMD